MDRNTAILKDLQNSLLVHFRSLAAVRKRSGYPIFALEHGMNATELQRVNVLLRERHEAKLPMAPYWLLWTVYASEAGYDYTGDEYWPSFEKQTPNWQYHDRPEVKSWFGRFRKSFNGVVPSGPWAKHFSIIAWPITHALLPRYLQCQFVKLLYECRFRLVSASLDAGFIGRLLAAHASHASTRFQAFLEQEELTGQIAAALLRGGSVDDDDLIHLPTLNRIVADLEHVRSSREWFKESRRVVSDRFKGIGHGIYRPGSQTAPTLPDEPTPLDTSRFVIRPDLFLRHAGNGKWSVLLRLKSLRPIAVESTALRQFLDRTRCRLNGASDWKPTGWLLSGNRMGALKRWPDANVPFIQFERPNPLMDHLLQSEYRPTPGPVWLFRIGSDGIARHIASRVVRPTKDYIVVTAGGIPSELAGSTRCTLVCAGVHAFRFTVPSQVTTDVTTRFRKLGFNVARTIRVWPAGLPGRGWDGDGSTEWLTTESPCFGIAPDHPLDSLAFRLNSGPDEVVATDPQGGPTFVRLPRLPPGNHCLTVEAHRSPDLDDAVTTSPAKGFVRLAVREPEPWTPGVASHPGLIVTHDPFDASLDVLWRNELKLSVNGPEGFAVRVCVKLHTADGREILSDLVDNLMTLPITPDAWCGAFKGFLADNTRAWKYLEAATCTIEINVAPLGTCVLRMDHDPSPLRWVFRRQRGEIFARLVDDSGQHETTPDLMFYRMDRPLDGIPLSAEDLRKNWPVPPPGGLFQARHASFSDTAVLSALSSKAGLQDLGVDPSVDVPPGTSALRDAFCMLRSWHGARQAGFLANQRQCQVTSSIVHAIFRTICGKNWANAVVAFKEQPRSRRCLNALESLVDRRTDFGRSLSRLTDPGENATTIAARFVAEAMRQGISRDQDLCRFTLRLASRYSDVLADHHLDARIGQLADNPALLRGARFVSLLRKRHHDAQPNTQP